MPDKFLNEIKFPDTKSIFMYAFRIICFTSVLIYITGIISVPGNAYEIPSPTRSVISLDGEWDAFRLAKVEPVFPLPAEGWVKQKVPGFLPDSIDPAKMPSAWIKRTFKVPSGWKERLIKLEFGAVSRVCKVCLNGKIIGGNLDMNSPFSFDVGSLINYDKPNELAVWVTTEQTRETASPTESYPPPAGIWQSVRLAAYPKVNIQDVFVITSVREKKLTAQVTVNNASTKSRSIRLSGTIQDWQPSAMSDFSRSEMPPKLASEPVVLAPGESCVVTMTAKWSNPQLWSPDDPHLYMLTTSMITDGGGSDIRYDRFGFREFWIDGTRFVLNGIKVNLPAIWDGCHEDPVGDDRRPEMWKMASSFRLGMQAAKASNIRAMRFPTTAYAYISPEAFDTADEVGMLIMCQNTKLAFSSPFRETPEFWKNTEDMVRRVVRRDRNHPSIIIWSMSNEWVQTANDWRFQSDMLWKMQLATRDEDPTRPAFQSGSGALDGRGEIISLHYPHEIAGPGSSTEIPNDVYWLGGAKDVRSLYLQYSEPTGVKPVALTEGLHLLWPSGPQDYYFWEGEDVYRWKHEGEWWGKVTEGFRSAAAFLVAGLRAGGASAITFAGEQDLFQGVKDEVWAKAFEPVCAIPRERDTRFYSGDKVMRTFDVYNDLLTGPSDVIVRWRGNHWKDNSFNFGPALQHYRIPRTDKDFCDWQVVRKRRSKCRLSRLPELLIR